MDVIVDGGRDFRLTGDPSDTLAAVAAVSEFLRERGRGILSLQVNGNSVNPEQLIELLQGKPVGEVSVLEVSSERIDKLVEDALREMQTAAPELPQLCHSLAEVFQGERPEEGYEPFHKLAEIWSHIKSMELQVAGALSVDLAAIELKGVTIEQLHVELNGYLEEAAQALESLDCVLLGDLLEYELAPRAEVEGEIIALLQTEARSQAQSG